MYFGGKLKEESLHRNVKFDGRSKIFLILGVIGLYVLYRNIFSDSSKYKGTKEKRGLNKRKVEKKEEKGLLLRGNATRTGKGIFHGKGKKRD